MFDLSWMLLVFAQLNKNKQASKHRHHINRQQQKDEKKSSSCILVLFLCCVVYIFIFLGAWKVIAFYF